MVTAGAPPARRRRARSSPPGHCCDSTLSTCLSPLMEHTSFLATAPAEKGKCRRSRDALTSAAKLVESLRRPSPPIATVLNCDRFAFNTLVPGNWNKLACTLSTKVSIMYNDLDFDRAGRARGWEPVAERTYRSASDRDEDVRRMRRSPRCAPHSAALGNTTGDEAPERATKSVRGRAQEPLYRACGITGYFLPRTIVRGAAIDSRKCRNTIESYECMARMCFARDCRLATDGSGSAAGATSW